MTGLQGAGVDHRFRPSAAKLQYARKYINSLIGVTLGPVSKADVKTGLKNHISADFVLKV